MPFVLHPSGYCVWFNESSKGNLIAGTPCVICGKTAGHKWNCPKFKEKDSSGTARAKLYNATAILCDTKSQVNFWTFTLPSRPGLKTYQAGPHCLDTGDLAIGKMFSKILEAMAVKVKRSAPPNGITKMSCVWVAEAQMKRHEKFGGIGDLHYHMLTDQRLPIGWVQDLWNSYFPFEISTRNSVHVESVPRGIRSIPAYFAKYFGKGSQRQIFSRRFGCTRDLSALMPVQMRYLPDGIQPISTKIITTPTGYESAIYYFNTSEVLSRYGAVMKAEKDFQGTRCGKLFTEVEIQSRAFKREIVQTQKKYNRENGIIEFPDPWVHPTRHNSDRS